MEPYLISAIVFVIKAALWGGLVCWGLRIEKRIVDAQRSLIRSENAASRAWHDRYKIVLFVIVAIAWSTISASEYGFRPQNRVDAPIEEERTERRQRQRSEDTQASPPEVPPAQADVASEQRMSDAPLKANETENREAVDAFKSMEPATSSGSENE